MEIQLHTPWYFDQTKVFVVFALLWLFSIGAFVLRKHILKASGLARAGGYAMFALAIPSGAIAVLFTLIFALGSLFDLMHLIDWAWRSTFG